MKEKSVKKTSSQVMELQQLIAGPLIATIEADALSAQQYLDYLMRIAFESYDPKTGKTGGHSRQPEARLPCPTCSSRGHIP